MEFRNALTILFSNIGYVVKIMLWIIISLIITAAVGAAILIPLWRVFEATTDVVVIGQSMMSTLTSVWNGSVNFRVAIYDLVPQAIGVLKELATNSGAMTGLVFTVLLLYAIYSFVMGLSYYTVADIINKLMASNLRFGFASNMALNFKKCCRYSFARLLISMPIDIVCFIIGMFLAYGLFTVIKLFMLPIMLIIAILFCSLRALLFSGWLPRMLHHPDERIFVSFSRAFMFVKADIGGLFKAYFVTFSCVYLMAAVFTVPTGGLILLVLPSIYYFLLRAVELVGYYKTKGYSFYGDSSTVINTVEFGFRASNQACSRCDIADCENCVKATAQDSKQNASQDNKQDDKQGNGNKQDVEQTNANTEYVSTDVADVFDNSTNEANSEVNNIENNNEQIDREGVEL